ncbi:MAG: DUF1926 domain-containing protein [Treponema sp.]|uniref:alpha-amylase/4-alpha-glucanotransferase domain-containing protein n=1 Tax=Treponema sp. TaxID=166 RepID=UPI00298D9239|nr:alpha-amylase/4-alpha-glucanotransferase domain-containing protein [Treponema sp.]MCQ2600090.1 DUF1926 domain-containing protein [Treponema sp.]
MAILNLNLEFYSGSTNFNSVSEYKMIYDNYYKPLVSFLYANPDFSFSFYLSGPEFEYIKKKNPEFLEILKKLVDRKQVEVIGGGFYNPVFPLLFPMDRSGQVDLLSTAIRKATGKRPRGVCLCASAWDPSLVTSFETCGMEYVELDSSLISKDKNLFLPIVMADRGKSIKILPVHNDFIPKENEEPCDLLLRIKKAVEKVSKNDALNPDADRCVTVILHKQDLEPLLKNKWLEKFLEEIKENYSDSIKLNLPAVSVKNSTAFIQSYIHAGISADIAKWAKLPFQECEVKDSSVNIYDFMQTYKRSQALYNRMIFVSLLVNQCHGDKMRKKTAREYLWAAQCGDAYVCKASGILVSSQERQNAYRKLTDAEKLVRECGDFKESITSFDYNCDGFKEYVCRMDKYNACINLKGGSIFELDVMKDSGNYADNMSRVMPMDKCNDNYDKGLFVDHLFEKDQYENYINGRPCKNGVFSGNVYKEVSFNSTKHEILLETNSKFPDLDQTINLKKKYIVTTNGIMVQYIIKNTSPIALKAKFVVESNFAQTCFNKDSFSSYKIEVVNDNQVENKTPDNLEFMRNVDAFQIVDSDNNVVFTFEPNETANLVTYPIVFMRKKTDSTDLEPAGRTLSISLAWDVDLAAGMEMEKTINLAIVPGKKRK